MDKNEVLIILETAKDENGEVPMRLVRQVFEKMSEPCEDTISRQAAIDALKDMYHAAEKWREEASDDVIKARAESCMASLIEMKLRIEKLPSAQPEIIRCKDCKHYDPNDHCYLQGAEADDFCSYAERREE